LATSSHTPSHHGDGQALGAKLARDQLVRQARQLGRVLERARLGRRARRRTVFEIAAAILDDTGRQAAEDRRRGALFDALETRSHKAHAAVARNIVKQASGNDAGHQRARDMIGQPFA
jgi:uncharacterized protein GlcG (DUF336 family)